MAWFDGAVALWGRLLEASFGDLYILVFIGSQRPAGSEAVPFSVETQSFEIAN